MGRRGLLQLPKKLEGWGVTDIISMLKRLIHIGEADLSVEQRINHWLKNAKRILTLVNANPALAAATLHLDNELPKDTQQLLLLALFGKLCRFNDHYLQHVLASLLATFWISNGKTPRDKVAEVFRFLRKHNLAIWQDTVKLQKALQTEKYVNYISDSRLNLAQRLCILSGVFATRTKKVGYQIVFTHIANRLPAQHRHHIAPLIPLFEGLLPGAKVYANGVPGALVDIQQNHGYVFTLSKDNEDGKWLPLSAIRAPVALSLPFEHFVALYTDTANARVNQGGTPFLPSTFAIQNPPKGLINIIDELQKQDVEIEQLCEKIEKVPTFNHFLMHTASQDNRLQLPVKSIKQAVLTYGIERVGDMLIQFALLERLTQNQFPLMGICKQITLLACSLSSHFAQIVDSKFTPQSAALTMTFVCTPLFTLPGFKVSKSLPVDLSKAVSINNAFKVKSETPWLAIASELAGSWHQSSTWRAVIHQCGKASTEVPKSIQKEQAILVLSFAIAKACLFHQGIYSLLHDINVKTLLSILNVQPSDVHSALESNGQLLFCPISL